MNNLDPELLRQILASGQAGGYSLGRGNAIWNDALSADQQNPNAFEQVIYGNEGKPSWASNTWDTWNTDGTYRGSGSGDSDLMSALRFAATAAAGYGLGAGIESLGAGSAGGVSGLADGASLDAFYGASPELAGSAASPSATLGGIDWSTAGGGLTGSTGLTSAPAGSAGSVGSAAAKAAGGLNYGSLLGAAAGALDGKDKTATSSKDPWAPAQPALLGLLAQGQNFMNRPAISPEMQAAYARQAGLLDYANSSAPGIFAAAQANASGANNYSRLKGK